MTNELVTLCLNAQEIPTQTQVKQNALEFSKTLAEDGKFTSTDMARMLANMLAIREQSEAFINELKKHASGIIETYQGDPSATANSLHVYGCTIKRMMPKAEYNFQGVECWEEMNNKVNDAKVELTIAKNNLKNVEENLKATGYYKPTNVDKDYTITLTLDK